MSKLLIFGMGFTASRFATRMAARGWDIVGTTRDGRGATVRFDDQPAVRAAILSASHILSSVPPANNHDPVLALYGQALALAPARWIGYLSSTGVYGDCGGAWVDESAPVGTGRRSARAAADLAWQALRRDVHVFRLPGIYGPSRSALDRVRGGHAHRIDSPDQVFSRVHVDDIVAALIASFAAHPGVFNIADDRPCSQNLVIEGACDLLGLSWPPLQTLDEAALSPMARGFYAENRRVANGKARRELRWLPTFPTWREGLVNCLSEAP